MRFETELVDGLARPLAHLTRSKVFPLRRRFHNLDLGAENQQVRRQLVGVSRKLLNRLTTYFQGGAAIRKEHAVAGQAKQLLWQVVGHEFAALVRELELIRAFQPRLNVRGRMPGRPIGYIYISAEEAPRLCIARRVPKAVRHSWGPMPIGGLLRSAIETANRVFLLRDCPSSVPMHFAEQRELFALDLRPGCLRGETASCLGPCAGLCTSADYCRQVAAARAFLDGRDQRTLKLLEDRVWQASAAGRFEQAARFRDTLESMTTLSERLARLREPPAPADFVYPVEIGRHTLWYFIAGGIVRSAAFAPISAKTAKRCLDRLNVFENERIREETDVDRTASQLVAAWFHSRPEEGTKIVLPPLARRRCKRALIA